MSCKAILISATIFGLCGLPAPAQEPASTPAQQQRESRRLQLQEAKEQLEAAQAKVEAAETAPAGGEGVAVAVPPGAELVVRTRRPGDRVQWHGREITLKRLLLERRIPAEERDFLPVLAAGPRVLWFPGAALEGRAGDRWIGLRLAAILEIAGTTA